MFLTILETGLFAVTIHSCKSTQQPAAINNVAGLGLKVTMSSLLQEILANK